MKTGTWIRRLVAAGLSAGTTLMIACAYGTYYAMEELANGRVAFGGQGVEGIEVCARIAQHPVRCAMTGPNGNYVIEAREDAVARAGEDGFELDVTDVDGPANGHYQDQTYPVSAGSMPVTVNVDLTEITR